MNFLQQEKEMSAIKAKIFCPKHGRLSFEQIVIKNGLPICGKCSSVLEFGNVKPRKIKK